MSAFCESTHSTILDVLPKKKHLQIVPIHGPHPVGNLLKSAPIEIVLIFIQIYYNSCQDLHVKH